MCVCVLYTHVALQWMPAKFGFYYKEVFPNPGKDKNVALAFSPIVRFSSRNSTTLSSRITQHVFRFENCRQPSHPSLSIFLLSLGGSTAHISNSFASCINCELLIIMVRKYRLVVKQGKQLEY